MSRILLVWQLGGNLGHIMPLRTLGRGLRARGHHMKFAFDDTRGAAQLIAEGFPFVQAPILHSDNPVLRGTRSATRTWFAIAGSPMRRRSPRFNIQSDTQPE